MFKTLIIVFLVISSLFVFHPQRIRAEEQKIVPLIVENVKTQPLTLDEHLKQIFGPKAKVAKAILKHESGLNLKEKGYNCYYYRKNKDGKTVRYSTSCKTKEDREKAWSVDCGIAQINVKGQVCPANLMNLDGAMKALEKKYKTEGLTAWVSYTSGAYKRFM